MATIVDVARRAGVSQALVSRYLNKRPGVSEKSRQKIQTAIDECGYRRNELARSLVRTRTRAIGVVIDSLETGFFEPLVNGIIEAAERMNYTVLFCLTRGRMELKDRAISYFTHKMVDGVLVYGSDMMDRKIIDDLRAQSFPFVLIENDEPGVPVDKALVDSRDAIRRMTEMLIERGYRDIRYIPWGRGLRAGLERKQGFVEAMDAYGLFDGERSLCFAGAPDLEPESADVFALLRDMAARSELPEAFICGADIRAADVLMACSRLGIDVPGQLGVAGFDGDALMLPYYGYPELTTMCQPLYEMGERAVEMLLARIDEPDLPMRTALFAALLRPGETIGHR